MRKSHHGRSHLILARHHHDHLDIDHVNDGRNATAQKTSPGGLQQPTAARPLTILDVGDSLGEDLGLGLGYTLGTNPLVHLVQAGYGCSGIDRPDYYDWAAHLANDLSEYHPQVVTILIGGNDHQDLYLNGEWIAFGTAQWHTIYSQRVALMMSETLKAGAKMLWVGLPIMRDPVFGAYMQTLNSIYQAEAVILTVQLRIKRLIEDHGGDENLIGFDADGILRGNNCN